MCPFPPGHLGGGHIEIQSATYRHRLALLKMGAARLGGYIGCHGAATLPWTPYVSRRLMRISGFEIDMYVLCPYSGQERSNFAEIRFIPTQFIKGHSFTVRFSNIEFDFWPVLCYDFVVEWTVLSTI